MAAPVETGIPGGTNADFGTTQGFTQNLGRALITPGRQEQSVDTRTDQLRNLLISAGSSISGAVNEEARRQLLAKQKLEERKAANARLGMQVRAQQEEADSEQERAYRKRLNEEAKNVEQTQFDILRDPRSENAKWVLDQAVMRQNNAGSDDSKSLWNDFILRYQEQSRNNDKQEAERMARVANADLISDRRIAAKTGKNAIDDLANQINMDGDLQAQLIGDGNGINDRVNEYVYAQAMKAAPELFDLDKKDPDYAVKMEQQTILLDELEARAQSTIVNPLTNQFISNSQRAMEAAGEDRMDVAAQAFAEGALSGEEYHDVVGDTLRTQFAHVDPRQRDQIRTKLYEQQFNRLAGLLDQPNPGVALERMESLLAVADLNENEKQVVRQQVISDKFPKAVAKNLESRFNQKLAEMAGITTFNDGNSIVPRDSKSVQLDMLDNGAYGEIAGQLMDELGINSSELTPLKANLLATINEVTSKAEAEARQVQSKAVKSVARAERFFGNAALTTEEAGDQWNEGVLMRTLSGTLSPDDPVFQSLATSYKENYKKDFPWDGSGPIPLNEETLPMMRDLATQEGYAWGKNPAAPVPRAMANQIESMILYDTPERSELAVNFWQGLGAQGQERLGGSLNARAQLVLMEYSRLYGDSKVGSTQGVAEIVNRVRSIEEGVAGGILSMAKRQAGTTELAPDPRFRYDMAQALSKSLGRDVVKDEYGREVEGFDIDVPGGGIFSGNGGGLVDGLSQVFTGRDELVPLYAQMALVMQSNPGTDMETAANFVTSRMREQGYKVVSGVQGKQIIKDRFNHFPTDVKPSDLARQSLDEVRTPEQSSKFVSRLTNPSQTVLDMGKRGAPYGEILWVYLNERSQAEPGADPIPHPRDWAFLPETRGPLFEGSIGQERGGVPMHVVIPGQSSRMLLDNKGNPLLLVSSSTRPTRVTPVDRKNLPDYYLTPNARNQWTTKPDAAQKMQEFLQIQLQGSQPTLDY